MESVTEPTEQTPHTAEPRDLESLLMGAVEQARAALTEFSSADAVGEYLGATSEDPSSVTHRFLANLAGYCGWQWAVVVAGYPGTGHATISELVLVPGPTALLAPRWVPWQDRVRSGDLGPGDLLAPPPDDPRLVPGYLATGDPLIDDTAAEIGFGRRQHARPPSRAASATASGRTCSSNTWAACCGSTSACLRLRTP